MVFTETQLEKQTTLFRRKLAMIGPNPSLGVITQQSLSNWIWTFHSNHRNGSAPNNTWALGSQIVKVCWKVSSQNKSKPYGTNSFQTRYDIFSRRFSRKEPTIVMAFRQCFFFDTPELTKKVLPKVIQNFQKTPKCTCWPKELNQKGFPRNIQYRTRPKGLSLDFSALCNFFH